MNHCLAVGLLLPEIGAQGESAASICTSVHPARVIRRRTKEREGEGGRRMIGEDGRGNEGWRKEHTFLETEGVTLVKAFWKCSMPTDTNCSSTGAMLRA